MTEQLTKNQRKGLRNEQESRRILDMAYRHASRVTDAWSPTGTTDVFRCADLIAVNEGWPTKFVQVKTNGRPNPHQTWPATFIDNEYTQFEWWARIDYEGWEIYAFVPTEKDVLGSDMELVLEIETGVEEKEAADLYREYSAERWGLEP